MVSEAFPKVWFDFFGFLSKESMEKCDGNTLPKTNIAPTNGWLEYYFPIGEAYFQGLR